MIASVYDRIIAPHERCFVAVSGGVDSMVLWHTLHEWRYRRYGHFTGLYMLHYHHHQRESADEDERFVLHHTGPATAYVGHYFAGKRSKGGDDEATLRQARYDFFFRSIRQQGGGALVLGHHLDDRIETALMHMMRGAAGDGIANMRQVSYHHDIPLLRPLLAYTKNQLAGRAKKNNHAYRHDPTNDDTSVSIRNQRRDVIKMMHERSYTDSVYSPRHRSRDHLFTLIEKRSGTDIDDLSLRTYTIPPPYRHTVAARYTTPYLSSYEQMIVCMRHVWGTISFRHGALRDIFAFVQHRSGSGYMFVDGVHIIRHRKGLYRVRAPRERRHDHTAPSYTLGDETIVYWQGYRLVLPSRGSIPEGSEIRFPHYDDQYESVPIHRLLKKYHIPLYFRLIIPIVVCKNRVSTLYFPSFLDDGPV